MTDINEKKERKPATRVISICVPEELLKEADARKWDFRQTRSGLFCDAVRAFLKANGNPE